MTTPISIFSRRYLTDGQPGRIVFPVVHWLFATATGQMLYLMHLGIRKSAHVAEFGLFSPGVFRGVLAGRTGWRWSWAPTTLVVAVAYAALDEWLHSFVPLHDAILPDTATVTFDALLALSFVWWYVTGK